MSSPPQEAFWHRAFAFFAAPIGAIALGWRGMIVIVRAITSGMERLTEVERQLREKEQRIAENARGIADLNKQIQTQLEEMAGLKEQNEGQELRIQTLEKQRDALLLENDYLRLEIRRHGHDADGWKPLTEIAIVGKVLIVDDDKTCVEALGRILAYQGAQITIAATVHDAIAMLETESFDMVLLDLMLPDGEGTEVLRHIKESGGNCRVCVMTAANERHSAEILKLLPDNLIRKPIDLGVLIEWMSGRGK